MTPEALAEVINQVRCRHWPGAAACALCIARAVLACFAFSADILTCQTQILALEEEVRRLNANCLDDIRKAREDEKGKTLAERDVLRAQVQAHAATIRRLESALKKLHPGFPPGEPDVCDVCAILADLARDPT